MELSIVKNEFINVLRTDNYAESSIKHYQKKLDLFIEFLKKFFKVAHCEQLEKDHIKAYLDYAKRLKNKRTKEPLSYNSFYGIVCHARSFCSYLTANDYMEKDYAHVFFVKFKRVRLDKRILKESQMEQLFKHIEGRTPRSYRDRVIFELFYNTGLRRSEVAKLDIYDLNFEDKTIFVRQGKGKKDRVVPLGCYLERYLKEYIENVRPLLVDKSLLEGRLFVNNRGLPFTDAGIDSLVRRYSEVLNIKFSCHTFRHTFATHMLKHGAGLVYLKEILGHKELTTTEIYTKIYPVQLKKIILTLHPRSGKRVSEEEIITPGHRRRIYDFNEAKERLRKIKEKRDGNI